ncbi:hypothetical protein CASFOL_013208 [Castilleja foliolosa]|uniref:F-box associated beta-propeller type 1 domain-containing protein n=1 Tax=Castilleja foliolosa TaxID=1961234 RepID=A0ABD3DJX2_9LAMI
MVCILTRIPVKTITRFKSVCKPWYDLFSTSEFKKLHQAQFSSDPGNRSFIVHTFSGQYCSEPENQFSIFNIESVKKRPTILDHPFDHAQKIELYTVGCCNGLVCIRRGQEIVLWNPAMKLSKTVPLRKLGPFEMMSLGFGYDAVGDDFKVVIFVESIVWGSIEGMELTSVEIYSANLDSWSTVDVGFQFSGFKTKNKLIVNGNPYCDAIVEGNKVLLCFDVSELVFKIVPLPTIYMMGLDEEAEVDLNGLVEETGTVTETRTELFDLNGAVGAIVINYEVEYSVIGYSVHSSTIEYVWVFDDIEGIWRNNHTFGRIEVDVLVDRVLHCTKNEKILTLSSRKLLVLDLETGCAKDLIDGARLCNYFGIYGYTESLASINGMEKVVLKNEQNGLDVCYEDDIGVFPVLSDTEW